MVELDEQISKVTDYFYMHFVELFLYIVIKDLLPNCEHFIRICVMRHCNHSDIMSDSISAIHLYPDVISVSASVCRLLLVSILPGASSLEFTLNAIIVCIYSQKFDYRVTRHLRYIRYIYSR